MATYKRLDEIGLAYLWSKIKALTASKQDKLTAGYGISITNNTISVSIPNANGVSF